MEQFVDQIERVMASPSLAAIPEVRELQHLFMVPTLRKFSTELGKIARVQNSSSKLLLFFVNDILDFSRIRANKFTKSISKFNIVEAVNEIVEV
mmetsp:Transcript_13968/g.21772  ORF Transcript_13968/g.21772 Transcript_13968/m.21772 type:complete len:94 (-) Transcript_13968:1035-1316(-)